MFTIGLLALQAEVLTYRFDSGVASYFSDKGHQYGDAGVLLMFAPKTECSKWFFRDGWFLGRKCVRQVHSYACPAISACLSDLQRCQAADFGGGFMGHASTANV
jgi:hypothetical protein